jgi:hypothetical protein
MKKLQLFVLSILLLGLFVAPVRAAAAPVGGPSFDDVVIFGQDYTVTAGQNINGSLVVIGGSATVEVGASVNGDLIIFGGGLDMQGQANGTAVIFGGGATFSESSLLGNDVIVFGGSAILSGHVGGDLVVIGGDANLSTTAVVAGDLAAPGGNIVRAEGSQVGGNTITQFEPFTFRGIRPGRNFQGWGNFFHSDSLGLIGSFIWLLFRSFALSTVALLVMLFAPKHVRRIADAILVGPVTSGGYGCLGVIITVVAIFALAITIILIPVSILLPFVLVAALAFGWIALGLEVGHRMAAAFKSAWSPILEAAIGTFTLTFVAGVVGWVPCLGWLAGAALGMAGLGAVILTRFGTQLYPLAAAPLARKALPAPKAPRKRAARSTKK